MDSSAWFACDDVNQLIRQFLSNKNQGRKLQLFSVACCRHISHLLTDERGQNAVTVAELFAEGAASIEQRRNAHSNAVTLLRSLPPGKEHSAVLAVVNLTANGPFEIIAESTANAAAEAVDDGPDNSFGPRLLAERQWQVEILRDLFGDLFSEKSLEDRCRSPDVMELASSIYELSAPLQFEPQKMSRLARSLRAAGCTTEAILNHFQRSSNHVRGCWVVDLLLGKK